MVWMIENLVAPAHTPWGMPGEVIPAGRLLHAPLHTLLAWSWGFIPVEASERFGGDQLAALDDQGSFVQGAAWLPVRPEALGLKVDDQRPRESGPPARRRRQSRRVQHKISTTR